MTTITLTKGQVQGIKDAPEERRRTSKQSKGPAGMTEKELKDLKAKKRLRSMRTATPASRTYTPRGMEMGPDLRSDEQKMKDAIDSLLAKGGEVKKLKGGGLAEATAKLKAKGFEDGGMVVKDKVVAIDTSPNSGLITTKGFGAGRKT